MIDALIAGRLHGKPVERFGRESGRRFATAKVRASTAKGDTVFADCIAFNATVVDALLALDEGDTIALSGEADLKTWTDKEGQARPSLDLVVHAVLTPYHVRRKRQTVAGEAEGG